jgi:ubiquitin carboxyl-terminal hydrolase 25/28
LYRFYAGLGAVEDFHDDLISFAYDCQRKCDPENVPYYLECLQGIAEGRTSESLQTKVAIEASSGIISFQDVRAAYKELGLDSGVEYEDETILGTFLSRIGDAPKQESQLRRALKVVGQSRSSQQIEVIASQSNVTNKSALELSTKCWQL